MFNLISRIKSSLPAMFLSLIVCANSLGSSDSVTAMAVKYEGIDPVGRKCDFYITVAEEGHEAHPQEEEHHILMKVDYTTLDGHQLRAGEAEFYFYNGTSGVYHEATSRRQPRNTALALLSISLEDPNQTPDANSLKDYIKNGELEQYIRVEFKPGIDSELFTETLEKVLEGDIALGDELDVFDSVQLVSMGSMHGDHYDFPVCLNHKPVGVEKTEFDLEGHDEEHGHN